MAVQTQFQFRRGTAAQWTSANPTLASGEFGYETDTGRGKVGDGTTVWNSLQYSLGAFSVSQLTGTGTGINTWLATPSSANLAAAVTDETGTGSLVFGTGPTISRPIIDNPRLGYTTTATSAGTTVLTSASNYLNFFTGTQTHTVQLPDVSTIPLGTRYDIENNSTGLLTVTSSGTNTVATIPTGVSGFCTSILTSGSTASSWDFEYDGFATITGTGSAVLSNTPTLTTPVLGVATATSINGTSIPSSKTLVDTDSSQALTNKTLTAPIVTFSINAQTGTTYTAVLSDAAAVVTMNNASANTFNLNTDANVNFAIGSTITVIQIGAGQTTIQATTPGTTTITSTGASANAPKCRVRYSSATCIKTAANTWSVVGDIA